MGLWLLAAVAIPASIIDIRELRIPDVLVAASGIVWATYRLIVTPAGWLFVASGAICAAVILGGVRVLSRSRLGLGDVKYSIALGALLGPVGWTVSTFCAATGGLIWIVATRRSGELADPLAFAPFLSLGAVFVITLEMFADPSVTVLLWPVARLP